MVTHAWNSYKVTHAWNKLPILVINSLLLHYFKTFIHDINVDS